jgi:hypothetical protein
MKRPGREIKSIRPGGRAALEENPREIIRVAKRLQNRPVLAEESGEEPSENSNQSLWPPSGFTARTLISVIVKTRYSLGVP